MAESKATLWRDRRPMFVLAGLAVGMLAVSAIADGNRALDGSVSASSQEAMPTLVQSFVLGAVQGLTEFLPISSTAHLRIVPALLGWPDFGITFSAVIQLGSLVAVFAYFAADLRRVLSGTVRAIQLRQFHSEEFRIFVGVAIGTLPITVVGIAIKLWFGSPPRQLVTIAVALIVLGLLLEVAERVGKRERQLADIRISDGIVVGCAQALALVPGVSRSGATITAGLFLGMERAMAARYAFLLGIPALTLAGVVEFIDGYTVTGLPAQAVGTLSAFIFSYLSIDWLLKFLQTHSTQLFVIYRIVLGIFLLTAVSANLL